MSAILSAEDLNDFISPGVACIKPVEALPTKDASVNPYEVTTEDKIQSQNLPPAQISLTDCLACSGCVTSAEAVLISHQSHTEVLNTLDEYPELELPSQNSCRFDRYDTPVNNGKIFVASVSPQVRASVAATYGISERKASYMIDQFLRGTQGLRSGGRHGSGFAWVVDIDVAREAVLALTVDEVLQSLQTPNLNAADVPEFPIPQKPILSSACPGWICYVEKTHPYTLTHLSRLKSPQALLGTLLKTTLSQVLGIPASQIWHLAIMPCFDKKLEASREELTDMSWMPPGVESQPPTRDVDCVITTRELLTLASSRGILFSSLPLKPVPPSLSPPFPDKTIGSFLFSHRPLRQTADSGTSGGYLHHVLANFQSRNPKSQVVTQRGRNVDVVEYTLVSESGQPILKAARYYGFRNIQNLVRKLKPARLPRANAMTGTSIGVRRSQNSRTVGAVAGSTIDYAYVEVMACPGGCTNGGGQIRITDAREVKLDSQNVSSESGQPQAPSPHEQRAWLARVDEAYFSAESDSEIPCGHPGSQNSASAERSNIHEMLEYWSSITKVPLPKLVYTTYRKIESDVGKDKDVVDTARVIELAGKIGGGW
jgi:iron only hydrogenase large subunit-like protein